MIDPLLETILKYNRANPVPFIEEVLLPFLDDLGLDYEIDKEYNVYVSNGNTADTFYIAHTDTCDRVSDPVFKDLSVENGFINLNSAHSCLGADDGAGVYILLKLLEHNIEGRYLFTTGEEIGLIGMSYWIDDPYNVEQLQGVERCVEFDRKGENEIIIEQSGKRLADVELSLELSDEFDSYGMALFPSTRGVYTDNILLDGIVPFVVNISCGYVHQHTPRETLNYVFLDNLLYAWMAMERYRLPVWEDYDLSYGLDY